MDIDSASQSFQVPPMLIMPLVENIIKHALSKTINRINLEIKTRYVGSELSIMVNNSWPESTAPEFEPGSGHSNIIATLGLEYTNAKFSIDFANNTTCALITIRH